MESHFHNCCDNSNIIQPIKLLYDNNFNLIQPIKLLYDNDTYSYSFVKQNMVESNKSLITNNTLLDNIKFNLEKIRSKRPQRTAGLIPLFMKLVILSQKRK